MALNTVTLTFDLTDLIQSGQQATLLIAPTVQLADPADHVIVTTVPRAVNFYGIGQLAGIIANDNVNISPSGTGYTISVIAAGGKIIVPAFTTQILFANGATQDLSTLAPVATQSALFGSISAGVAVYPSGDTSGVTDQANITAAEALGRTVYFAPGTFWVTGLTKQASTLWQGSGRNSTTIKLAAGANKDVVQGASFTTLTLSGSATGGIGGWGIRDMTIDGNKASQAGTSNGIRVFGYDFDITSVTIRNCLSWGLYTEWGGGFVGPGPDNTEEARYYGLKIYSNSQGGWHDRGPHDSRSYDITISNNGAGFPAYWSETCIFGNTVAAGSNGADLSTFTSGSPGTLNVSTTLGYPSASISATQGSIIVPTALGNVTLTYTGTTATTFTGCVAQGSPAGGSTVSTGAVVSPFGPAGRQYGTNGTLHEAMHCYGSATSWQYQLDGQVDLIDCIGEVAATGMVLVRVWECGIIGGHYFVASGASQTGCGIQIGDAANNVSHLRADTYISNLAGAAAATAALNIVSDNGSSSVDALVFQPSGTAIWSGGLAGPGAASHNTRYRVITQGQSSAASAGLSFEQIPGVVQRWMPTAAQVWTLSKAGVGDVINLNTTSNRLDKLSGLLTRWWSDNYMTPRVDVDGATGNITQYAGIAALAGVASPGLILAWAAATAYKAGQLISYNGLIYQAVTGFTTPGSFTLAGLTLIWAPVQGNPVPAGQYIFAGGGQSPSTSAALGTGNLRVFPWFLPHAATLTQIGAEITAIGDAGSKFRLGIYADTGAFAPGALILDAGTIAGDSATVQQIAISQAAGPAILWVGGAVQVVTTTQPTVRTFGPGPYSLVYPAIPGVNQAVAGWIHNGTVSGALPGTFLTTGGNAGAVPRIFVKG
jgi:hypothetical protein